MATSAMLVSVPFSSVARKNEYYNNNNMNSCSNVQCDFRSGIAFAARKDTMEWSKKTVSNGGRVESMQVWSPLKKRFETLSYLPPLDDAAIGKEIDYVISRGWIPSLEFDTAAHIHRTNHRSPGYYDGRYWTLWKLPMFGCSDSAQVLAEIQECTKAYPNAYIRCIAFDNQRHVQAMAFLVHKPE